MTEREKELTEQVEQLTNLVKELREQSAAANAKIAELEEHLNKNSQNSFKPPSSNGYKKPSPKSLRKPSGKKQGGQPGHKGSTLRIAKEPTETVFHMPNEWAGCPRQARCGKKACVAERYVADAVVDITLTAHESLAIECPHSGERLRESFPAEVNAPVQYGENLNALFVAFYTVGAVSTNRIHELFGNIFGIPLSTGTVIRMVHSCAATVKPIMEDGVRDKIAAGALAHFDETGCQVNQRLKWVHVASTNSETFLYLSDKRGSKGMDEGGVLPAFHGVAVHDCWVPYWKYNMEHSVCCALLLRELAGIQENHPEQSGRPTFQNSF